ncbi:leucine-rich_repeat protein [Hexamita inflata]|uniref:Leucine-rich repeat protein n=1 Tax=Hexamita inflata TaxID=28002 RepID=A0AA86RGQ5_9EUKA|nr:leucine-rich repeat protein [Hexamita inflata]
MQNQLEPLDKQYKKQLAEYDNIHKQEIKIHPSKFFLNICLYVKLLSAQAAQCVFMCQKIPSLQEIKQREEEIIQQYNILSIETVMSDILEQIEQQDKKIIQDIIVQQLLPDSSKEELKIQWFEHFYSLKLLDKFQDLDLYSLISVSSCHSLIFDEISTRICNLTINNCSLQSIDGLQNMKQLKSLELINNYINDFQLLNQLDNLIHLSINRNQCCNVDLDLTGLPHLFSIDLSDNGQCFNKINLNNNIKFLNLSKSSQFSIYYIQSLTNLVELEFNWNYLGDTLYLANLSSLTKLNLIRNSIKDLSSIYNCHTLVELNASFNLDSYKPINLNKYDRTIHGSVILQNLRELSMYSCSLSVISDLKYITSLQYLNLTENQISDIQPLQFLTNLNVLILNTNRIQNIWPLKPLQNLEELRLSRNEIIDVQVFKYFPNLKKLFINKNQIYDVSSLAHCVSLQTIKLQNNCIDNLSPYYAILRRNQTLKPVMKRWQKYFGIEDIYFVNKIQHISASNDENQNYQLKTKTMKNNLERTRTKINEIVRGAVISQLHFTNRIILLFQQIE